MSNIVLKYDLCSNFVVQSSEVKSKKVENEVKTHLENNHRPMLQKLLNLNSKEDEAKQFDLTLIIRTMFTESENEVISNMKLKDNKQSNAENEKKKSSTPKRVRRPAQCNICKKIFTRAWCLKIHMKTHDPSRKEKCEFCFQTVVFEKHKLLLKTCDLCELNSCNASDLELHLMFHQGKVKFECQVCFSRFNFQKALRRHESGHVDDHKKPFSCIYFHCKTNI